MKEKSKKNTTSNKVDKNELRHTKELFSLFMKHSPIYTFIKEVTPTESRVLQASENFIDMIGIPGSKMTGKNMSELFPLEFAAKITADDWAVVSKGEILKLDEELNGRSYITYKYPLELGKQTLLAGYTIEITELVKAKEKLSHMHNLMQYVISHAQSAIAVHDKDMKYIYVSAQYLKQYNIKEKDILGKHHYDVFPNLPQKWRDVHKRVLSGAVEGKDEDPYEREDGSVDWTRWECRPWYENDGLIGGLIVYTEVITERKRKEEKLQQSEQFIRNILDTVDEGFLVIDCNYRIISANKSYCKQVELPIEDVIGQYCYKITHKSNVPCHECGVQCAPKNVFETGEPCTMNHKHLDPQGNIIYIETKGFPIKDSTGQVTSVIEIINNFTEKYLLEEERLKTQKLESIGTLAGGIAHDFNNLLQGVFGFISMAKMDFDRKEQALSLLEQAEKGLHQSVNLTNQLLTFSKGGKPIKKRISIHHMIENSVKFALSGSNSQYSFKYDSDLMQINADEGQLGQVIHNIVLNADQAMPTGGKVEIEVRNILPSVDSGLKIPLKKNYIMISIKDTGSGIPEAYLGRIFDPYFTTKQKGSGLGLATSYSIIKNHDGFIDVKSEMGKGTIFRIFLPAAETFPEQKEPVAPKQSSVIQGRILVMDDEEFIRNVVGKQLTALGHIPSFACDGIAAIEEYRKAKQSGVPFDAVILDLTIRGGKGGEETIKELLKIDPGVKGIVSSGYSDDASMSNYIEKGFKAFLKKPYNLSELKNTLNSLLA